MRPAPWIAAMLLTLSPGSTFADTLSLFPSGEMSFTFDEFPFGSLSGAFLAGGDAADLASFPPGGSGAAVGVVADSDSTDYFIMAAGVRNPDGSVDLAFVHIRADAGVGTGSYQVDPLNQRVLVGFIDNGRSVSLPDLWTDLIGYDYTEWLALIDADHKFLGALGSVVVTTLDGSTVEGSFDGLMADISSGVLISVTQSGFRLARAPSPVDKESWGAIKGRYQR